MKIQQLFIKFCLILALIQEDSTITKIIQISRHAARAPINYIEMFNNDQPNGKGNLTKFGRTQVFLLSRFLRSVLVQKQNLIKDKFDVSEVRITSDLSTRCVESAHLFGYHLFNSILLDKDNLNRYPPVNNIPDDIKSINEVHYSLVNFTVDLFKQDTIWFNFYKALYYLNNFDTLKEIVLGFGKFVEKYDQNAQLKQFISEKYSTIEKYELCKKQYDNYLSNIANGEKMEFNGDESYMIDCKNFKYKLLQQLKENIAKNISDEILASIKDNQKYKIYFTHDTQLMPFVYQLFSEEELRLPKFLETLIIIFYEKVDGSKNVKVMNEGFNKVYTQQEFLIILNNASEINNKTIYKYNNN